MTITYAFEIGSVFDVAEVCRRPFSSSSMIYFINQSNLWLAWFRFSHKTRIFNLHGISIAMREKETCITGVCVCVRVCMLSSFYHNHHQCLMIIIIPLNIMIIFFKLFCYGHSSVGSHARVHFYCSRKNIQPINPILYCVNQSLIPKKDQINTCYWRQKTFSKHLKFVTHRMDLWA